MMTEIEKKKNFLIRLAWFAAVIGISIFVCRKALFMMMPFVIALIVSLILQPAVRFFTERMKLPKGLTTAVLVFAFYIIVGLLLLLTGTRLVTTVKNIVLGIPTAYTTRIEPVLTMVSERIAQFVERLDPAAAQTVDTYFDSIGLMIKTGVSNISFTVLKAVTGVAVTVPSIFLKVLITVIATVFLAQDIKPLRHWILMQLSEEKRTLVQNIIFHLGKTLKNYVRGYGSILLITFAELSIGLWIIGINNFVLISAAIALLDILPVVGCGTVLIPWTLITVVYGDYRMAASLAVLYLIITVVRNFVEPKIVGDRVGLHPIVTLSAMVAGTSIYGGIGLLGLPITIALLVSLNEAGAIRLFKPVSACADYDAADTLPETPAAETAETEKNEEKSTPDEPGTAAEPAAAEEKKTAVRIAEEGAKKVLDASVRTVKGFVRSIGGKLKK